ncbi:MAG: YceH family protein [Burkholderiales bacterium]
MSQQPLSALSLLETRVLGVLVEKQHTVPDTYPLSLNSLLAGCNQKTSRDPVLSATEDEVQAAVDSLKRLSLVMEGSGNRVTRYEHNVNRVLQLPPQSVAILTTLMLRGPQTPGELRINCERLYKFSDLSSVEVFLNELRDRSAAALVVELPRRPGARENRWAHLLCGAPAAEAASAAPTAGGGDVTVGELAALKANMTRLEDDVAALKATVANLCAELGVPNAKQA